MTTTEIVQRQERYGTASEWSAANTVLLTAEIGIESDTRKGKIGDGATPWNSLAYSIVVGPIPATLADAKGDLIVASAADTVGRLAVGANGLALVADSAEVLGVRWASVDQYGLFAKADAGSCALTRTGAGTVSVLAGTYVQIASTLVSFAANTAITMPTLTAGTDYFVYAKTDGTVEAVAATGIWPTPVASPPANSRLIGGCHYAPGGNATGVAGGDTTPGINPYSLWDLKFRPAADDPRGMALVANMFWADVYLLNRDPDVQGTSRNNQPMADGETASTTTAHVPALFGGNGTTHYARQDWWSTAECLSAYGKRLPTYAEFAALAYGTSENVSRGSDPVTTGLGTTNAGSSNADQKLTSKWGIIQASGVLNVWGADFAGGAAAAAWANTNGGRGQVYQQSNAAFFGGYWGESVNSGSRCSNWDGAPSASGNYIGGRGVCSHRVTM